MATTRSSRYRDFATVVYPESAPEGWIDILKETHIPCFISPLHDKDVNADGKPKKEHYHVMVMFTSVKTEEQAIEVFKKIGGVGCEIIATRRGYARYLIHKDNPEKHQYSEADVVSLSGADYFECISLVSDKYAVLDDIIKYIRTSKCDNLIDLYNYADENEAYDWKRVIQDKTFVCDSFCKANERRKNEIKKMMNAVELANYAKDLRKEFYDEENI